jgi:hypothetical protein
VEPARPLVGNGVIDQTLRKLRRVPWCDQDMVDELVAGRREHLANIRAIHEGRELEEQLWEFDRVAKRAERRLPASWQAKIGLADATFGVPWPTLRDQAGVAVENESGHWIRAPFEFGKPGPDGLRSRTVELQINDLAGLLNEHGAEFEFWMVMDKVGGDPRWVLPTNSPSASPCRRSVETSGLVTSDDVRRETERCG